MNDYSVSVTESWDDGEAERLAAHLKTVKATFPPEVLRQQAAVDAARFEEELRATARGLMAVRRVSQAQLAEALGVSQSSVHHMLTGRQHGLTLTEVFWIEELCEVRKGTIYEQASYIQHPSIDGSWSTGSLGSPLKPPRRSSPLSTQ